MERFARFSGSGRPQTVRLANALLGSSAAWYGPSAPDDVARTPATTPSAWMRHGVRVTPATGGMSIVTEASRAVEYPVPSNGCVIDDLLAPTVTLPSAAGRGSLEGEFA